VARGRCFPLCPAQMARMKREFVRHEARGKVARKAEASLPARR